MAFEIRVCSIDYESEAIKKYHERDTGIIRDVHSELEKRFLKTSHEFETLDDVEAAIRQLSKDMDLGPDFPLQLNRQWDLCEESKKKINEDGKILDFPIRLDSLDIILYGHNWYVPENMTADEAYEAFDWLEKTPLKLAAVYPSLSV